jgi:hypothetical protein
MKQKLSAQNDQDLKFKVMIRVRPKLPKEEAPFFREIVHISGDNTRVDLDELFLPPDMQPALTQGSGMQSSQKLTTEMSNLYNRHSYTFDHVFDPSSTQEEVYTQSGIQPVHYLL